MKTGSISGILIDSLSNKPIGYANFLLYRQSDSAFTNGTMSDTLGHFTLSNISYGAYYAKISVIGYKSRRRKKILINNTNSILALDTIKLSPRNFTTQEVQITAEKEKLVEEDNKVIVNVNRTMGNNASEVLENTPMVRVDIDGNISLQGRRGTIVYIDGAPAKYSGFEKADDLKLLAASDIDKIELELDPGFEYSERASGGIINIITKKRLDSKYSASTSMTADTKNDVTPRVGVSYTYKSFFTRGGYSKNFSKFDGSSSLLKTTSIGNKTAYLMQSGDYLNKSASDFVTLNLGYNADNTSNITASFSFRGRDADNRRSVFNQISENEQDYFKPSQNENTIKSDQQFFTYSLNYMKRFQEKGRSLSALIAYSYNLMSMKSNLNNRILTQTDFLLKQNSTSDNNNNSLNYSVSYNQPLSKEINANIGYSGVMKRLVMENNYNVYDNAVKNNIENPGYIINTKQQSVNQSAFGTLRGTIWDINYLLGLSADNYNIKNEETLSGNNTQNNFFSLAPAFSLNRKFQGGHTLGIAYTRWSLYPKNRQLNPHIDNSDSTDIIMGNPDLKPYHRNDYSVNYKLNSKDLFIRASFGFSNTTDIIESISIQENLHSAVTTYRNLAGLKQYEFYLYASKSFFSWLAIDPEAGLSRREYNGISVSNSSYSWNTAIRSEASFSTVKLMLDFRYNSPEIEAQSKTRAIYYSNAALKLLLFDSHLSLMFKVQDIFNTLNRNRFQYGTGFSSINTVRETSRIFSLSISYYFQSKANDSIDEAKNDSEEFDDDF